MQGGGRRAWAAEGDKRAFADGIPNDDAEMLRFRGYLYLCVADARA